MSARRTKTEIQRSQVMATVKLRITEAMDKATEDLGDLYYTEWLSILNEIQATLIRDLVRDDWADQEEQAE